MGVDGRWWTLMVVDDSMDEGVDVYCGIWLGGEVEWWSRKPNQAHFYVYNHGIGIHNPTD
jgi:hypothetical protein